MRERRGWAWKCGKESEGRRAREGKRRGGKEKRREREEEGKRRGGKEKRREREEEGKRRGGKEERREKGEGMRVYSCAPSLSLSRIYLSSV